MRDTRRLLSATLTCLLALVAGLLVPVVLAAPASAAGKTSICHATNSHTNPYRRISVAQGALTAHGKHHGGEAVWSAGITTRWDDIIPDATAGGSNGVAHNWSSAGIAIYKSETRTAAGSPVCRGMSAKAYYDSEIAAGVPQAAVLADLNSQRANEDAALLATLGGSFTAGNVDQLDSIRATTDPATPVGTTTATLRGTVVLGRDGFLAHAEQATLSFLWGTNPHLTVATTAAAAPAVATGVAAGTPVATAAEAQLTGLTPGQTYYYRLVAVTDAGLESEATLEGAIRSFMPTGTTTQPLVFEAGGTAVAGSSPRTYSFDPSASGNPTSLTSETNAVCAVTQHAVTPLAIGTCTLTATVEGNATYLPASVTDSFSVTAPAGPAATAKTSTGVGTAVQTATLDKPAGTTVTLLDGDAPVTSLTLTGVGSYVLTPSTGVVTFTPELGHSGPSTVGYQATDAHGQSAQSTYTATVTLPDGPEAEPRSSRGTGIAVQFTTPEAPPGGTVKLLDGGAPASAVLVPGGRFTVDMTGTITFTPNAGTAAEHVVDYRITDAYGQHADSTYTATVVAETVDELPAPGPVTEPVVVPPPSQEPVTRPTTPVEPVAPSTVERITGADRLQTAAALALQSYPEPHSAAVVVVARDDLFADGLAGSPLAGGLDGPLLLTDSDRLSTATREAIDVVLAPGGTVFVLGGPSAVSPGVVAELAAAGHTVERVGGADRYETATLIADRVGRDGNVARVFVATGLNFPDALSASSAAGLTDGVIVLTAGATMPPSTASWLARHSSLRATAVGGAAAAAAPDTPSLVGVNRYATAARVAGAVASQARGMVLVTGTDFPDGLAAASYASGQSWPMLLVDPRAAVLDAEQTAYLDRVRGGVRDLSVVGGVAAVPDAAAQLVRRRLQ